LACLAGIPASTVSRSSNPPNGSSEDMELGSLMT
jgi:hypothetical protein